MAIGLGSFTPSKLYLGVTEVSKAYLGASVAYEVGGGYDSDAQAYFDRVEGPTGDNQALETPVKDAINAFVVGCKADGIWTAIKSSAILAGARTLNGALQPLVGTAPTNFNFVSGDYNRKTGLKGDGSTKYLNSNRKSNIDPQNSYHNAVYYTEQGNVGSGLICAGATTAAENIYDGGINFFIRNRSSSAATVAYPAAPGFIGHSRNNSANFDVYTNGTLTNQSIASLAPVNADVVLFQRNGAGFSTYRLSFYSIGESLDLALLDGRITTLIDHITFYLNTGLDPNNYDIDTVRYINAGYAAGGTLA